MSNLISRSHKPVQPSRSLPPPTMMSPPSCRPQLPDLPVGPSAPHVPASSPFQHHRRHFERTSIRYDDRHQAAPTADQHSLLAHDVGAVMNYNLENVNDELLGYINRLFADRYKQWKSDLHHHFQAFDDPQAALQEGCPKELEGREDSWQWLCGHFQEADYEGSKFPEIDVFGDVYVRPGNELAESLHTTMIEKSQLVLQESGSQLPPDTPLESVAPPQDAGFQILTDTLDQTLGRRPGTYCRGMGNARRREPRSRSSSQSNSVLTAKVAQLETQMAQMAQIIQSMAQSGVPVPSFVPPSTSAHGHQTFAPVPNVQTSEPHLPDEEVDLASLFN
ncbi:hypothetical protein ACE6H2_019569 [Prunus campanulata]